MAADARTHATRPSGAVRLHSLDGVRAIAASLVVVAHLGALRVADMMLENGQQLLPALLKGLTAGGVELFFVLSGVVLARPYLRSGRPMDVGIYFLRRAKRLFPPFLVAWLLSGLSVYLAWKFPTWWTQTSYLPPFELAVWLHQLGIIYWGSNAYNWAWWSLSTEVAFYVLFPLLIPVFARVRGSRTRVLALMGASIAMAMLAFVRPEPLPPVADRLLIYASCFCSGMLLAAMDFTAGTRRAMAIAGALWVASAAYLPSLNPHVGWGLLAFALVSSALDPATGVARLLARPLFVWLGERSYSLFLTHFAVIVLVCHAVSAMTDSKGAVYLLTTRLLSLPLMLLAAMLLFHFVERRFAQNLVTADAFWPWSLSRRAMPAHARNHAG